MCFNKVNGLGFTALSVDCRVSPAKYVVADAAYSLPLVEGRRLWRASRPDGIVRLPQFLVA